MTPQAADFSLPSLAGERVALGEAMRGRRGAVVVFWSAVCSHCQRYDGYLNRFSQRHPELALLAVACRQGEGPEDLRRAAEERDLGFPILLDGERELAHRWQVHQTPRAFLVSPDRELLYRGAIDNFTYPDDPEHAPYLEQAIDDWLAGRPVRRAETPSFGCATESVYYR